MQAMRSTLGKIEEHSRAVAIGVTAVIVLVAFARPHLADLAQFYLGEAGMPQPQLVMRPGYQVLIDGHPTPIAGNDECPQEKDPQRAFWLGGRPDEIPAMGCVVVGPATKEVHVQVNSSVLEVWKVVHQERNGFPVTLLERPNGDYIAQAK
jgi:ribosome modulation factor